MAYGKRVTKIPRQCVFFGTTNDKQFLRDKTGDRRFWPMQVGVNSRNKSVFKDLTEEEVDQCWAEAMMFREKGEGIYLNPEEEAQAELVRERHTEDSSKEGTIKRYLDIKLPIECKVMSLMGRRQFINGRDFNTEWVGTEKRTRVCAMEIWAELLGGDIKSFAPYIAREINDIIRNIEGGMTTTLEEEDHVLVTMEHKRPL